jgi:hypothetical protein
MPCRMSEAEARRDSVSLGASSPAPSQGAAAATIQARLTQLSSPDPDFNSADINSEDFQSPVCVSMANWAFGYKRFIVRRIRTREYGKKWIEEDHAFSPLL